MSHARHFSPSFVHCIAKSSTSGRLSTWLHANNAQPTHAAFHSSKSPAVATFTHVKRSVNALRLVLAAALF
jgi:hypothetical protein